MNTWRWTVLALLVGITTVLFPITTEAAKLGERNLSQGMNGEDVLQLQSELVTLGFDPGPVDGQFGSMTKRAIMLFEQAYHLTVDGVAGTKVLQAIHDATNEVSRGQTAPARYKKTLTMESTAYAPFTGGGGNVTYSGTQLRRGVVAVDPRVIPLGTRLYIDGYGYALAEDIGGSIKGNRVDVAMMSVDECYQWGIRDVTVYILD